MGDLVNDHEMTRTERLLMGALAASTITVISLLIYVAIQPGAFDPISYSPDPRRIERVAEDGTVTVPVIDGYAGPAVHLGETVPTTGQRCNSADTPVRVVGSMWWQEVGTSRRITVVTDFPTVFEPGCVPLRFENDIPDEVADYVKQEGASLWQITGSATPVRDGGVTSLWRIEPVWVVPDGGK